MFAVNGEFGQNSYVKKAYCGFHGRGLYSIHVPCVGECYSLYLFSRAREDLRACNQRINTMLADYGDVVPRREFEMMETTCQVSKNTLLHYRLIAIIIDFLQRTWKLNPRNLKRTMVLSWKNMRKYS